MFKDFVIVVGEKAMVAKDVFASGIKNGLIS